MGGAATWPFKCERAAWELFGCVPDTFFAMPGPLFAAFEAGCLGKSGCFPDAYEYERGGFFDDVGLHEVWGVSGVFWARGVFARGNWSA